MRRRTLLYSGAFIVLVGSVVWAISLPDGHTAAGEGYLEPDARTAARASLIVVGVLIAALLAFLARHPPPE